MHKLQIFAKLRTGWVDSVNQLFLFCSDVFPLFKGSFLFWVYCKWIFCLFGHLFLRVEFRSSYTGLNKNDGERIGLRQHEGVYELENTSHVLRKLCSVPGVPRSMSPGPRRKDKWSAHAGEKVTVIKGYHAVGAWGWGAGAAQWGSNKGTEELFSGAVKSKGSSSKGWERDASEVRPWRRLGAAANGRNGGRRGSWRGWGCPWRASDAVIRYSVLFCGQRFGGVSVCLVGLRNTLPFQWNLSSELQKSKERDEEQLLWSGGREARGSLCLVPRAPY